MKSLVLACCLLSALLMVRAHSDDLQFEGSYVQEGGGGRFARGSYHDGGSSGGGGGSTGGGHGDQVEYGAHTGEKGAFEWHADYPVHSHH